MNQTRPAGRKPDAWTTVPRWRARHRSRAALSARGWSREDGPRSRLAAASGSVASQTGPRKGARPGARRGQRWPGHDVRHGVMPPWPASAGRRRSDAVPRSSASRATGARPGQPVRSEMVSRCRGPASPLVVPRGSPRVPGAAMPPGSPVGERQEVPPLVHSPLHGPDGLARPALTGTPHVRRTRAGYACTSRTVPREGPRAQRLSASAAGRHDGTTVVMLQDGKPRRATGFGLPATADHRNALLVRSKALKSHRTRWHRERNLETT